MTHQGDRRFLGVDAQTVMRTGNLCVRIPGRGESRIRTSWGVALSESAPEPG